MTHAMAFSSGYFINVSRKLSFRRLARARQTASRISTTRHRSAIDDLDLRMTRPIHAEPFVSRACHLDDLAWRTLVSPRKMQTSLDFRCSRIPRAGAPWTFRNNDPVVSLLGWLWPSRDTFTVGAVRRKSRSDETLCRIRFAVSLLFPRVRDDASVASNEYPFLRKWEGRHSGSESGENDAFVTR